MKHFIWSLLFLASSVFAGELRVGPQQVVTGLAKGGLPSYILNPQCEKDERNITDSSNILTRVSSGGLGDLGTDCQIDATASGQKAVFAWRTYPNRLEGANCEVVGHYKGDASLYKVNVVQNSVVLNSLQLTNSTNGQEYSIQFPCGSDNSQAITVEIEATDNAAAAFNHVFLHGGEYQTYQVAQAQLAGRSSFAATASCLWSRTNTALGDFTSTAACPGPTIEKQVLGSWQTTDTNLPEQTINNLPAGEYELLVSVPWYNSVATATAVYAVSDGTSTSGQTFAQNSGINEGGGLTIVANFSYSSAGNRTFKLQCSASSGSCNIDNQTAGRGVTFQLKRFPTASEQVLKIGAPGSEWTAFTPTGSWTINTTYTGRYKCEGDTLHVDATVVLGGAPNAATELIVNHPTGFTADTSKMSSTDVNKTIGFASAVAASNYYQANIWHASTTTVRVSGIRNSSALAHTLSNFSPSDPATFGSGDRVYLRYSVPVTASSPCPRTPMPLVKQAVTTSSEGVLRVETGVLNCDATPSVVSQVGDWLSTPTRTIGGRCTAVFKTGIFSSAPNCSLTGMSASNLVLSTYRDLNISKTATAYPFYITVTSDGALSDGDVEITCVGPL